MNYKDAYEKWLTSDKVTEEVKAELSSLSEKEIEDRFYKELEFGTAGLRGIMGAGTNRMNIYTVRKVTQGLALEILDKGKALCEQGVVIAHDSRNNSALFAKECAKVLCANGIKTYLFESLRPTPELSFAVRYLGCARGVVVTASHNPKEYNGYKVYGEDGGQLPPEVADIIIGYINKTDIFEDIKISDTPDYISIGEDVDKAYSDLGIRPCEDCYASRSILFDYLADIILAKTSEHPSFDNSIEPFNVESLINEMSIIKCTCMDLHDVRLILNRIRIIREKRERNGRRS